MKEINIKLNRKKIEKGKGEHKVYGDKLLFLPFIRSYNILSLIS